MDWSNWLQRRKCYIVQRKQNLTFDWLIGLIDRLIGQIDCKIKKRKNLTFRCWRAFSFFLISSISLIVIAADPSSFSCTFVCEGNFSTFIKLYIFLGWSLSTLPQFPAHLSVKVTFMVFHIDAVLSSFFNWVCLHTDPLLVFLNSLCVDKFWFS